MTEPRHPDLRKVAPLTIHPGLEQGVKGDGDAERS